MNEWFRSDEFIEHNNWCKENIDNDTLFGAIKRCEPSIRGYFLLFSLIFFRFFERILLRKRGIDS